MAVSVKINGTLVNSRVLPVSINFTRNIEYRGSANLVFKAPSGDALEPVLGQSVQIYDGASRVWYGSIDSVSRSFMGNAGWIAWTLTCVTLEQRLDRHFVSPRLYAAQSAGSIVADLLSSTGSGEGIAAGTIEGGVTVGRISYDNDRLTDAIAALAKGSNKYWMVDADVNLHFVSRSTFSAPFNLDGSNARRINFAWEETKRDRRTRQLVRCGFGPFAAEVEVFVGDGSTQNFTLTKAVSQIDSVVLSTGGSRAATDGTFTGAPNDGDTITVGALTYTFRNTIDNAKFGEVRIGGGTDYCTNLAHAINNDGGVRGTGYSLPTWTNPLVKSAAAGPFINFVVRRLGADGNATALSESLSNFTLSGPFALGSDGVLTDQTVGVAGVDTDTDWFFAPDESGMQSNAIMAGGSYAIVSYRPVGGDVIAVEDTALAASVAAIEGTTGVSENLVEAEFSDAPTALNYANGLLDAYKPTQETIRFSLDDPGLKPGQLLTVNFASAPFSRVNGGWLLEEVSGQYSGTGIEAHFRYTCTGINGTRRGQWIQAWEALTSTGGASSSRGSIGGSSSGGTALSGAFHAVTFTADATVSYAAPTADGQLLTVEIAQDATGGWVVTWDAAVFAADTLIDVYAAPSKVTRFLFMSRGGKWYQCAPQLLLA